MNAQMKIWIRTCSSTASCRASAGTAREQATAAPDDEAAGAHVRAEDAAGRAKIMTREHEAMDVAHLVDHMTADRDAPRS